MITINVRNKGRAWSICLATDTIVSLLNDWFCYISGECLLFNRPVSIQIIKAFLPGFGSNFLIFLPSLLHSHRSFTQLLQFHIALHYMVKFIFDINFPVYKDASKIKNTNKNKLSCFHSCPQEKVKLSNMIFIQHIFNEHLLCARLRTHILINEI